MYHGMTVGGGKWLGNAQAVASVAHVGVFESSPAVCGRGHIMMMIIRLEQAAIEILQWKGAPHHPDRSIPRLMLSRS